MPFFAVSCVEDLVDPDMDLDQNEKVTITLHSGAATKTMLVDDKSVIWEDGDIVDINNNLYPVRLDVDDPSIAYVDNVLAADTYYAHCSSLWFYYEENGVLFQIPPVQDYRKGSFAPFTNQMIAYSTSTDLHFYNAASILKLGIKGNGEIVKSITVSSNGNEPMSGYYLASFEDFENLKEYNGLQTDALYRKNTYVQLDVNGRMQLGGTPEYAYFVVPAQTYASGITVTVTDMEGRVCHQSTSKSITTHRSGILPMSDFTFKASEALAITNASSGTANVEYTVTSAPGQKVSTAVVLKTMWDRYMADYGPGYESAAATAIVNSCGSTFIMPDSGSFPINFIETCNYNGYWIPITAGTDYMVIASYANGPSIGAVTYQDCKTADASERSPEISVEATASANDIQLNVFVSGDAAGIVNVSDTKAVIDELTYSGMSIADIAKLWGAVISGEELDPAKSETGLSLSIPNRTPDTEYSFLFIVVSENGAYSELRVDVKTSNAFGVDDNWVLYSDAAVMDCGLLNAFGEGSLYLDSLVVEKHGDCDIFRILDLNEAINEEKNPYSPFFDVFEETQYFYIDARDVSAVVLPYDCNFMYMSGGPVNFFSTAEIADGFSYGSYDQSSGTIHLGSLAMMYQGDGPYLADDTSVLYLGEAPERPVDMDGWGIVGDLNGWGYAQDGSTVPDIPMEADAAGEYLVAYNVSFPHGYFKLRQYGQWTEESGNVGLYQIRGMLEVDHVYDVVDSWYYAVDMYVAAGTYDVWFDPANLKIYVMTPGRSISEAVAGTPGEIPVVPEPSHTWYLVGEFNNWVTADEAYKLTETGNYHVFKGLTLSDYTALKFNVGSWDVNRGGYFTEVNAGFEAFQDGPDIVVPAGTYDVYMSLDASVVYFMEAGKAPADVYVPMQIAEAHGVAPESYVFTTGYVAAQYSRGFLLTDGTDNILVYETDASLSGYSVGTSVYVYGQVYSYGGMNQIQYTTVVPTGSTEAYTAPTPVVYTASNIAELTGKTTPSYIQYDGILSVSGSYYNVAIEGSSIVGSVSYPVKQFKDILDANVGAKIRVTGYHVGTTGGGVYVNTMVDNIEILEEASTEVIIVEATVAEFLAAAEDNTWYKLTGTISNVANTTYGNFDLVDETGTVYVYGLTATQVTANDKSFSSLGLKAGDTVTLIGKRASYNGSPQVGGPAYYVSHVPGADEPVAPGTLSYELGANAYDDGIAVVNGTEYPTIKIGTSKNPGSFTVNVPAGTRVISFYAVAWKGQTGVTVDITTEDGVAFSIPINANDGATSLPPYTITATDADRYAIECNNASDMKVTVTSAKRVVFWGFSVE